MSCLACKEAPICKAQVDIWKARLKIILIAVQTKSPNEAIKTIQEIEGFYHDKQREITEARYSSSVVSTIDPPARAEP